ncbi:MAG: hypothetical protein WCO60_05595 [Verrucomicrobiota bacterium]
MSPKKSGCSAVLHNPEDFIQENFTAAKASVEKSLNDITAYTQLYPEKALLWAVGGGYLLRMLPLSQILGALIRIMLALLKPAALLYGAAKIWQKAQPVVAPQSRSEQR